VGGTLGKWGDRLAVDERVHGIRQILDVGNGVNTIAAVDEVRRTIRVDNDGVISVASGNGVDAISREKRVPTRTAENVVGAPLAADFVTFATAKQIIEGTTAGHEVRTHLPAHDVCSSLAEQPVTPTTTRD